MDLIKKANEIVNGRNDIYPPISDRTLKYICSGIDIKLERMMNVIDKIRTMKEDPNGQIELREGECDTLIDCVAYLQELGNRIK